jgi:phosphate transport system substrate-binding protein
MIDEIFKVGKKATFFVVIAVMLMSCIGRSNAPKETLFSGFIEIVVDETLVPIIKEEIDVFEAMYPNSGIVVRPVSEYEAINLLLRDSTRLAVMARPLSNEEIATLNNRKLFPQSVKMAEDGIAFVINKNNKDSVITVENLKRILNGDVQRWTELFPKSNLGKFSIAYDNRNSSTIRYIQDSVISSKELSTASFAAGSSDAVVDYVKKTPNAIGVIGVNWISSEYDSITREFLSDIQVMRVKRDDSFTGYRVIDQHSSDAIACQPYQYYLYTRQYPFIRSIYLNVNDPLGGLPTGFTNFITSQRGQRIILKSGLLPATMPINIVNIRENL